eukprot:4505595-Prymnesium_polylepis.1
MHRKSARHRLWFERLCTSGPEMSGAMHSALWVLRAVDRKKTLAPAGQSAPRCGLKCVCLHWLGGGCCERLSRCLLVSAHDFGAYRTLAAASCLMCRA